MVELVSLGFELPSILRSDSFPHQALAGSLLHQSGSSPTGLYYIWRIRPVSLPPQITITTVDYSLIDSSP